MSRWTQFNTSFDRLARETGISLNEAHASMLEGVRSGLLEQRMTVSDLLAHLLETGWARLGRPSYRVARPLAEALLSTDLDVEAQYIRLPHKVFAVELPVGFDAIRNREGHKLESLLVGATRMPDLGRGPDGIKASGLKIELPDGGPDRFQFLVIQRWEQEKVATTFTLSLDRTDTIESRIRCLVNSPGHDPTVTDEEMGRRVIGLALGAALFAVGANSRFVRPVTPGTKRNGRRAHQCRAPEARRWTLGADIQLPRGRSVSSSSEPSDGEGRELKFAHLRQGHLRLTPVGPVADRRYVLKYIAPTVVRPDLPLAPMATRHAMDK